MNQNNQAQENGMRIAQRIGTALRHSAKWMTRSGAVALLALGSLNAHAITGPTVTITSLTDEQIIQQKNSIVVNATATSPDGPIQKVEFFVDSVKKGEDTAAPYTFTVPPLPPGRHSIAARAWDPTSSRADAVWVYVNQTPWGDMTAPENGTIVQLPTSIVLKADAIGTEGVTKVEFRSNGTVIGTVTAKPYEFTWNPPAGFHTVDALVSDKLGGVEPTKDTLSITVIGSPPAAATVTGGVSRKYTYDVSQNLCRTVEPETGATLMGYDAAGNLTWSAAGLPATTACDAEGDTAAILARKVSRTYDARNRLKTLTFPDGQGNQTWTYTADNLPASIVTDNGGDQIVTNSYGYNRLRALNGERMQWGAIDWRINYNYNALGHLSSQTYPDGTNVAFDPDALGQPRQVGTFASDIAYYPNGAVASFTYGNNIKHTLTQNLRQLPARSLDDYGTTKFIDDSYSYDTVGNVAAIGDGLPDNRGDRVMEYDGLNRLAKVKSAIFGGGVEQSAFYSYDKVDNLTGIVIAGPKGRIQSYCYDASNRLTNVKSGDCSTGSTVIGLGYDVQGNLANKSGQTFSFDYGNRLRGVNGVGSYVYDGYGRRARDYTTVSKYSLYNNGGQLTYTSDGRTGKTTNYFYLGNSLVASQEKVTSTGATTVLYQHTDALGSPVAVTNQSRTVVERSEYEPFGQQIFNRPATDGPGYTGHVFDSATAMNYMQQRYYDPLLGRFLSVDPITADSISGGNFNRYWYANNNPYRFTDPDGRCSKATGSNICETLKKILNNIKNGAYNGLSDAGGDAADGAGKQGSTEGNIAHAVVFIAVTGAGDVLSDMQNHEVPRLKLKLRSDWSDNQKMQAREKAEALNKVAEEGKAVSVKSPKRSSTSASERYRRAGGEVPKGSDVDHTHDLQLSGADVIGNMKPLDSSVNRSFGSQIQSQIKKYPEGTSFCGVDCE